MAKVDKAFGEGLVYQYASSAVFTLSGAIFYILLVHSFPPDFVGSAALLIAIITLFPLLFTLGLQYGWQHFTSFALGRNTLNDVYTIKIYALRTGVVLSTFSVLALFIVSKSLAVLFFHSSDFWIYIWAISIVLPASIVSSFLNSIMLGLQEFKKSGAIVILYVLLTYALATSLLYLKVSLYAIPISWGIGYAFGAILLFFALPHEVQSISHSSVDLMQILRYSLPLYATGIITFSASYVDRFVVAAFKNLADIGIYTIVLLLASGTALLSSPIGNVIFSKFSEFYATNDKAMIRFGVRHSINAASLLYVPAALGLASIAGPVLRFLTGPSYQQGTLPLVILLVVNAIFVSVGPLTSALQGVRLTHVFLLSASLSLLSNLVLSFILIPTFSLVGASIGLSSVSAVGFFITYAFSHKAKVASFDLAMLSKIWISSTIMASSVYALEWVTRFMANLTPLYVATGAFFYLILLKATSTLSDADKLLLVRLLPRRLELLKALVDFL